MSAIRCDQRRYRLLIAYDGTAYGGWQIQPNADSIQARIESRLRKLSGQSTCKLHGSGRTDQGVHARGQVAHVDLCTRLPPGILCRALNAGLPADIRIMQVAQAHPDFHARRSARAKEYRYFVWQHAVLPPDIQRYTLAFRRPLDREAMRSAASMFIGEQDFRSFAANPNREMLETVRRIDRFEIAGRGRRFEFRITGNGFLYKMVRSMVGFLLKVGEGTEPPQAVREILKTRERTARVPTAPPQGLFLWRVFY